ncbi:MAG: acylneuraminate cytidylyltransferase family protein [Cellvibrionaceae bacterium]|nr:acylneuraminate cytidylyltransferase family protein [Cellvibrionaceae bacterium]
MPRIIGIIPARGGSKGVKRKNIRPLNGRPLIDYAIASARNSRYLNAIYITTDDCEITAFARAHHVQVISRGDGLSNDCAKMVDVVTHALQMIADDYQQEDIFCLLQPTCPLRTAQDIDDAIRLLLKNDCDAVVGMSKAEHHHPERLYQLQQGRLTPLLAAFNDCNRQDLPTFYIRNGIIYALRINRFLSAKTFSPDVILPLEIPPKRAINIDTEDDFCYAEFLLQQRDHHAQSLKS